MRQPIVASRENSGFQPVTHDTYISVIEALKGKIGGASISTSSAACFVAARIFMEPHANAVARVQASYMAQVQHKRLHGGLILLIFVLLMVSGFRIANDWNVIFEY